MRPYKLFAVMILIALANAARLIQEQEQKVRYDYHRVYNIKYENSKQRQLLLDLTKENHSFRVWYENNDKMHLMVSPDALIEFEEQLKRVNASANIVIANVQKLINNEQEDNSRSVPTFGWTRYNSLTEIEDWLDKILAAYPDVTKGFILGVSYEGRNIRGIKISYKSGNPGVFIESNTHAREWITSATATWLINELLSSSDDLVRELAENHDWYIVPVLNVDGFVYSHTTDRLWRKTRQPSNISSCIGADPNRNYDTHWMENGGASSNPCAEDYAGPHAFSEPEIRAMSNYVGSIRNKLNVMLAFHSYSQLLLSPYGHTGEDFPDNYGDLMQVAKAFGDAVESLPYGAVYKYGSAAGILYPASGTTHDWAYDEQNIRIAYTIEFRDTGKFGFVLPPAYIIPNAEEALVGIVALLAECKKLGYLNLKYEV